MIEGLVFHDLTTFNLAILGKQYRRLLHNSQALWVKVIKAWYFPDEDFMHACIDHRPSWIWASLLAG